MKFYAKRIKTLLMFSTDSIKALTLEVVQGTKIIEIS